MPNPRFKGDNYSNFGGINVKVSPYQQGPQEFLDLKNLDFNIPGALTSRYGSTQYIQTAANFTGQIQSLKEFVRLSGSSMIVTSVSGGIWVGATTGQFQGLSLTDQLTGSSFYAAAPNEFHWRTASGSYVGGFNPIVDTINKTFPYYDNATSAASLGTFEVKPMTSGQNQLDMTTFVNNLFICDGQKFVRFDGVTTYNMCLPGAIPNAYGNGTVGPGGLVTDFWYGFYGSYVNNRGFEGPIWPLGWFPYFSALVPGATILAVYGSTMIAPSAQIQTPLNYGISAINIYAYQGTSVAGFDPSGTIIKGTTLYTALPRFIAKFPASGSTLTGVTLTFGATAGNIGPLPPPTNYIPFGITNALSSLMSTFFPRYMEQYSNRLFLAGFSTALSTVWFSDTGEPEGYQADWNFEVRTNDGDRVTAMKAYGGNLAIWKFNSFHMLSGDNPANFFVKELSDEYGCVSNRATEIFNDQLVFLDRKGVMRFNGAGLDCLSDKIQPIIDSINLAAATDNATMVHDKTKNQILLGVPVNGATYNNLTIVYDYLIGAWTTYDSFNPAVFAIMQGRLGQRGVFYGGYSGMLFNFGASLFGDNGVGFTCYLKTRFLHDMGESVSKQFRRLYLNTAPVANVTLPIQINFYQDYGASIVYSATMYQNAIQNRIDFGIPAKSLSFDLARNTPSLPIQIHGFAMEYRFQRNT